MRKKSFLPLLTAMQSIKKGVIFAYYCSVKGNALVFSTVDSDLNVKENCNKALDKHSVIFSKESQMIQYSSL